MARAVRNQQVVAVPRRADTRQRNPNNPTWKSVVPNLVRQLKTLLKIYLPGGFIRQVSNLIDKAKLVAIFLLFSMEEPMVKDHLSVQILRIMDRSILGQQRRGNVVHALILQRAREVFLTITSAGFQYSSEVSIRRMMTTLIQVQENNGNPGQTRIQENKIQKGIRVILPLIREQMLIRGIGDCEQTETEDCYKVLSL